MANDVFAVIADKTRRAILTALKDGARPVGELVAELGVSQPTVSKHLKILREAGMVSMEARGQRRLYAVEPQPLAAVADWIQEVAGRPAAPGPAPVPTATPAAAAPVAPAPSAEPAAVPPPGARTPLEPVAEPEAGSEVGPVAAPGPVAGPSPVIPLDAPEAEGVPSAAPVPRQTAVSVPEQPAPAAPAPARAAGGLFSTLSGLRRRGRHRRR